MPFHAGPKHTHYMIKIGPKLAQFVSRDLHFSFVTESNILDMCVTFAFALDERNVNNCHRTSRKTEKLHKIAWQLRERIGKLAFDMNGA